MKTIAAVTISLFICLHPAPVLAETIKKVPPSMVASAGMIVPPSSVAASAGTGHRTEASTRQSQPRVDGDNTTAQDTSRAIGLSNVRTLLARATSLLGSRYAYGAEGPSTFDCSGFVRYVFKKAGIDLPHNAAQQAGYGKPVDRSSLQPGDLVFFSYYGNKGINHSGIYLGEGKFIHASSSGKSVVISSLGSSYYQNNYRGARRITR